MGIVDVRRGRFKVTKAQRDKGFFRSNFTEIHRVKKHKAVKN
jgi:hypothetical protein